MRWRKNRLLTFFILLIITSASSILINLKLDSICPAYATPDPTSVNLDSIEDTSLVTGTEFSINLSVEEVTDLWGFQFELTFNPDVIQGVYPIPTYPTYPFEMGPFLGSADGTPYTIPGAGWDNTIGKLHLTGGALLEKTPENCPDGSGVLATITFEVVGLGETEIRLGENTALKDLDGAWIIKGRGYVGDGYFRNIDLVLTPTASFTWAPVDTPVPLEGYNTTFTSTSTPAQDRTIVTHKWYFWTDYPVELDGPIITNVDTATHNYTRRGKWNVTLTVIDDQEAVGTITHQIDIKAHDVAITAIKTNTKTGAYPLMNRTEIGEIVEVNVTATNQGHFKETFDVTCFWAAYYAGGWHYGTLGTQYGITLDAGANTLLAFYWDTEGCNIVHPNYYVLHANASRVEYEYDVEWTVGKIADNELIGDSIRVNFHDVAITEVTPNATTVSPGEIVEVEVTVLNRGDYNETSITVNALYDENIIDTQIVPLMTNRSFAESRLPGNYTTTLTFLWDTTGIPNATYRISANVSLVPEEYDTINNLLIDGTVRWQGAPEAAFVYSPAEPVVGEVVTFNASASTAGAGVIANYTWNFGDGNITTVAVPVITHAYTSAGTYTVTLNVTDTDGLSDIEQKTIVISSQPSHDIAITEITASPVLPTMLNVGDYVTIHIVVMNEGNVEETFNVNVYYDSALIETRPSVTLSAGATKNLTFIWNTLGVDPGTYTISAEVPAIPGEVDTTDNTRSDGVVEFISPPEAAFVYSPAEPVVGEVVTFNASASTAGAGVIANYTWNFGDGNITTVAVPVITHAYTSAGTYTVNVTVTNDYGLTDTDAKEITVGKLASTISISAVPATVTEGEDTTISGLITPTRAGVTVTISYKLSGETTWSTLGTASTNANSQYTYTWTPTTDGEYNLKASWQGDANTLGDESNVITVTVEATEPEPTDMTLYIVAAAAIVVVVAAIAVYFLKFRKR